MNNSHSAISTGDFVPPLLPPVWTPYAQAIAEHYAVQVPLFMTVPTTLTGVALQRRTVVTDPFEHDVLLMAAVIQPPTDSDNGQGVLLDLFDQTSGINWVVPNILGGAPLTSFGGQGDQVTSVMRLPEAFFLPAHTSLQHEFTQPLGGAAIGGAITWVGIQLINPIGGIRPDVVNIPGAANVRVGSRMPWFCTVPLGFRFFSAGVISFSFTTGQSYLYYTAPVDCPLEIHDLHTTSFSSGGVPADPDLQNVKLSIAGRRDMWTPDLSPFTGVYGDRTQVFPALPMVKPLKLAPYEKLQFRLQNNDASGVSQGLLTVVRGVRLCEF